MRWDLQGVFTAYRLQPLALIPGRQFVTRTMLSLTAGAVVIRFLADQVLPV